MGHLLIYRFIKERDFTSNDPGALFGVHQRATFLCRKHENKGNPQSVKKEQVRIGEERGRRT